MHIRPQTEYLILNKSYNYNTQTNTSVSLRRKLCSTTYSLQKLSTPLSGLMKISLCGSVRRPLNPENNLPLITVGYQIRYTYFGDRSVVGMSVYTKKSSENIPLNNSMDSSLSRGWLNGFIGMLIFSGSLPATRVAVLEFTPLFLTGMRAVLAALLALAVLLITRQKWPQQQDIFSLIMVAAGVVIGFPLLTALALQHTTSAHSLVYIGLLPLATACFAVLRGGERPRAVFWVFSILGSLLVGAFALSHSSGGSIIGDVLMVAAVLLCGLGYAEGALLSRKLGGWQVISWALVISLPLTASVTLLVAPEAIPEVSTAAWIALTYVSLFSMWIGFIFWYRGLAQGGIAAVGQLQLLQPFFGLALAGLVLHETVQMSMIVVMTGVLVCVFGAKKFSR